MKITAFMIKNFLTIGEITGSLDDRGLVLIQGENLDDTSQNSNGAGKSSISDAISWALFGITAREETGDAVINNKAKRGAVATVALKLDDNGTEYFVERQRRKGKSDDLELKVCDGTSYKTLTGGTNKLTQASIEKILGCSKEVFNNAIIAGQEKMPDLPGMTDKQLKTLVEEAAGVDRLQRAYEVARARLRDAKVAVEDAEKDRNNANLRLQDALETLDEAKTNKADWARNNDAEVKRLTAEARQLKDQLDLKIKAVDDRLDEEKTLNDELAAINAKLTALSDEKDEEARLAKIASDDERAVTAASTALSTKVNLAKNAKTHLQSVHSQVGEPCSECGKTYEEADIEQAGQLAEKRLSDLLVEVRNAKQVYEDAQKKASESAAELNSYRATMTDASSEIKRRDEVSASLREIQALRDQVNTLRKAVNDKILQARDKKAQENPHIAAIERAEKRCETLHDYLKDCVKTISDAESRVAVADATARVYGPAGVRAYILDTVTPFLNDRTNHYLGILTDGNVTAFWSTLDKTKKGDIREKFTIDVRSKVGASSFKGLSGGEKRKARLACSLALQDLVSSRATKPIKLYVADEIDDALDDSGLERLMAILEDKASDRGTVLVISHNSLNDWCRQSVTVVKEKGMSRLEGTALEL